MSNRALKILSYILWILCTAVIVFFVLYTQYKTGETVGYFLLLAFVIVSRLTASGIHELGHAFFGLFSGIRAKLTLKSFLPYFSATQVQIIPRRTEKIKSRLIVTALGGIIFNLIFIVLGYAALFVPQIPIWISTIAVFHLSTFFDNALPIMYKTGKSDGLIICELLKNTPEAEVTLAVLSAQAHILNGGNICELPQDKLFNLPQIREDDPAFISLCELRGEYLKAAGDEEGAAKQFELFERLKEEYIG